MSCYIWVGVPGTDQQPCLSVPHQARKLLLHHSQLFILTKDGQLLRNVNGTKKFEEVKFEQGDDCVEDIIIERHVPEEVKQEEPSPGGLLSLFSKGDVYKLVVTEEDVACQMLNYSGPGPVVRLAQSNAHTLLSDARGQVWSHGQIPQCGQVHATPHLARVPFFSGIKIVQAEASGDFSVCVVVPNQDETAGSPISPTDHLPITISGLVLRDQLDGTDRVDGSCPLGLSVSIRSVDSDPNNSVVGLASDTSSQELTGAKSELAPETQNRVDSESNAKESSTNADPGPPQSLQLSSSSVDLEDHPLSGAGPSAAVDKATSEPPSETSSYVMLPSNGVATWPKCGNPPRRSASMTGMLSVESTGNRRLTYNRSGMLLSELSPSKEDHSQSGGDIDTLLAVGEQLCQNEVWSWGHGNRGQLGHGDMLPRPTPTAVRSLQGVYVLKVSVGRAHALALTATGLAYGWGDNSMGQASPTDRLAVVPFPSHLRLPRIEDTIRDVAADGDISGFLCDNGKVYLAGCPGVKFQLINIPSNGSSGESNSPDNPTLICDKKMTNLQAAAIFLQKNHFSLNMLEDVSPVIMSLVTREKILLNQVNSIHHLIRLLHTNSPSKKCDAPTPIEKIGLCLKRLSHLLNLCIDKSRHVTQLSNYHHLGLYQNSSAWISLFLELCRAVCNCIALDCLYLDSHQTQHQPIILSLLEAKFSVKTEDVEAQKELEKLLLQLLQVTAPYLALLTKLQGEVPAQATTANKRNSYRGIDTRILELTELVQSVAAEVKDAHMTRDFWQTTGPRLDTSLHTADRRLVLDSRFSPIHLSGTLTKHWVLLLSDVWLDVGYQQTAIHPLDTVWVDTTLPQPSANNRFEIVLTMPEETKILVASSTADRNKWVQALHKSITNSCKKDQSYRGSSSEYKPPPISRVAKYEFVKGDFKGCNYDGSWMQGKMHGRGCMRWPDGSVYTGEWRAGLQDGLGSLIRADGSSMEGTWKAGKMTGHNCRLVDRDGSTYVGDVAEGLAHGHGTRKEGKFMKSASVYIGEWSRGLRHGYGVLEDMTAGEKYMGMWAAGVRSGRGCVVNTDGIYYEGNFVNNRLTGGGTMIFEDGAVYEGEFCGAGKFSGRGVLTTSRERFDGVFQGNYDDQMKFNGNVVRHSEPRTPVVLGSNLSGIGGGLSATEAIRLRSCPALDKWRAIFANFDTLLGQDNPWDQLAIAFNQAKTVAREAAASRKNGNNNNNYRCGGKSSNRAWSVFTDHVDPDNYQLDYLETIPEDVGGGDDSQPHQITYSQYCEIERYLSAASQCAIHPLFGVFRQLEDCFNTSYGDVRAHPVLLPHAKEELDSFANRLYRLIRRLFPRLPDPDSCEQVWLSRVNSDHPKSATSPESDAVSTHKEPILVTPYTLVYPLLLPRVHSTIFTMYTLQEQKQDKEYWARILRWNKHSDATLLTFFDLDFSEWDIQMDRHSRDKLFLNAIDTLQRMKTTFTPEDKMAVIASTFKAITSQRETAKHSWSMDSLLPVCMYVVVRARILHLGAELAMLQDFMDTHLFQGEQGIMYTTLLAAYNQILRESVFIN